MLGAIVAFTLLAPAWAENKFLQSHKVLAPNRPCKMACEPNCPWSSRPGVPCLPEAELPSTWEDTWRKDLGERILKAATPEVKEEQCGGFTLFGDSVWCKKLFEKEQSDVIGLSFGIEQSDLWSTRMSNWYHMDTKLFDCFQDPASSPPLAMTLKNNAGLGNCKGNIDKCYEKKYEAFRVCLGPKSEKNEGRDYMTLHDSLAGRPEYSTHLKIDVEGSEWTVLEDLLKNEDDMRKIKTLDMEVHFAMGAASEPEAVRKTTQTERIERQVKIFEELGKKFSVLGSNIETNSNGWPGPREEPPVYTKGGFAVNQFAISFANKELLNQ